MELELKHILPYLDFGIKAIDLQADHGDNVFEITGFSNTKGNIEVFDQYGNFDIKMSEIKPILRPLSDLTKEIDVNGEKFIPIEKLNNDFRQNSKDLNICMFANELSIDIDTEDYSQCIDLADGFRISEKLLEWHFDISGLIENNLAINKNTL